MCVCGACVCVCAFVFVHVFVRALYVVCACVCLCLSVWMLPARPLGAIKTAVDTSVGGCVGVIVGMDEVAGTSNLVGLEVKGALATVPDGDTLGGSWMELIIVKS